MHGKFKCFLSCLPLWMIKMIEMNFNLLISVKIKQLQGQILPHLAHIKTSFATITACCCPTWKREDFFFQSLGLLPLALMMETLVLLTTLTAEQTAGAHELWGAGDENYCTAPRARCLAQMLRLSYFLINLKLFCSLHSEIFHSQH